MLNSTAEASWLQNLGSHTEGQGHKTQLGHWSNYMYVPLKNKTTEGSLNFTEK